MSGPEVDFVEHQVGRVHHGSRPVGVGDVGRDGRLRLDAAANYLQEVASADVRDAGVDADVAWVVRRTTLQIHRRPRYGEQVDLTTWCSGTGAAWAERRTSISVGGRPAVEAVALWVCLDTREQRPVPVTGEFFDPWREAAGDRRVRSKLLVAPAPEGRAGRPWPLRMADIDLLGHVNNAVAWAAAEEAVSLLAPGANIGWGQVEYREPIGPEDTVEVLAEAEGSEALVWLVKDPKTTAVGARFGFTSPGPAEPRVQGSGLHA